MSKLQISNPDFKVAILDLYNGVANEGMRCIKEIIESYATTQGLHLTYEVFDVRQKNKVPDLSFDFYISTGGPGSPLDTEGSEWEKAYFGFTDQLISHNNQSGTAKKQLFLICHSFQIFCRHYEFGHVCKRKSTSFGVFPIHRTAESFDEPVFRGLENPFWAVDSRDYQVIKPDLKKINDFGGKILCIEKYRPHVPLDRAIMSIRFNDYIVGTQFHPEADPNGMLSYLKKEDKKEQVVKQHGSDKYYSMLEHLNDPDKIVLTHASVLPAFIRSCIQQYISV